MRRKFILNYIIYIIGGDCIKPFIISVSAIPGGGKTTITKELQKRLLNSKALFFDDRNYEADSGIDICTWYETGADANLFNLERLADDIENLKKENLDFIIIDYPFGYNHKQIGAYINYSVFIDIPLDIAMARRILRNYNKENIISVFDYLKYYLEKTRNIYLNGFDNVKKNADFVADGTLKVDVIAEHIYEKTQHLKQNLCK